MLLLLANRRTAQKAAYDDRRPEFVMSHARLGPANLLSSSSKRFYLGRGPLPYHGSGKTPADVPQSDSNQLFRGSKPLSKYDGSPFLHQNHADLIKPLAKLGSMSAFCRDTSLLSPRHICCSQLSD